MKRKKFRVQKYWIGRFCIIKWNYLVTKHELFFTKVAPVQCIADIVLLGFSLTLLSGMFISYYTIIYFFIKIFFSNVYISVNTISECSYLSFGWEIGYPLSMYVARGMEGGGGDPKCLQMCTGGEGHHASCIHTRSYTISFHVFVLWCLVIFVEI